MRDQITTLEECGARRAFAPQRRERGVQLVVLLTAVMTVLEISVGYATGSMALLADGWHMATHVGALGLASVAYWVSRRFAHHRAFALGTGKVRALAGYTSAVALGLVALSMVVESIQRLATPHPIDFVSSLPVAVLGLAVNLASIFLLHAHDDEPPAAARRSAGERTGARAPHPRTPGEERGHSGGEHDARQGLHGHDRHDHGHDRHDHDHDHDHQHRYPGDPSHSKHSHAHAPRAHGHHGHRHHKHEPQHDHGHPKHDPHHGHHDHNHRAAFMHVVADAFTSVLAIGALLAGRFLGWGWLDAVSGIVGGLVILKWGASLARSAAFELLDVMPSPALEDEIRRALEALDDVRVQDLHVWSLGGGARSCVVSLVTTTPRETRAYRAELARFALAHLTVEVERCEVAPPPALAAAPAGIPAPEAAG